MADPEQKYEAQAPVKKAGIKRAATAQSMGQDNADDGEREAEDRGGRVPHMASTLSGSFTRHQRARTLRNDEADTAIATAAPPAGETPMGRGNNGGLAASRWATPPIPAVTARDWSTHGRALNVEADVAELATASVVPPKEARRGRRGTTRAHRRRKSAPPAEPRGRITRGALAACRWSSASPQSSPSHDEDGAYAFHPLGRNIGDSFMNQAPPPSRQETEAYAPSILLVPDVGTQTDPPPAPKPTGWADGMNEAPNGGVFTPISAPSATRPPQIVLGRGGMITPPMMRRYEPVIPSSSSQHLKYDHKSAPGGATGTLLYAPVWRKKDAVSDLRSATLEDPYLPFVMRDHCMAYRGESGTSDLESTEPKDPRRAFEGRYQAPTKGAPWESLSRQPAETPVEDFGRSNNHVPAAQDSRTQSNQVTEVEKEAEKDDMHMSLSEAKKLINSFNARDWLQKNGPFSKNGPVPTKMRASSLNMPGRSYAEAHQHKKPSPERLKEKWVAKIGAKEKEKAVVGTVIVAEKQDAGHSKNEDVEEPSSPKSPPQDDSTAEAPVEEVNDVAEHATAEQSGDKKHEWRSGLVRFSAAFKERVKHVRPLSPAQMNARSSKFASREKWTSVRWIVSKAEHTSATPSTDKNPPPLTTLVFLPIYYGTRPPNPEVALLIGWKLAQAMPVFDGPLTTPVLDADFYGSKVASFGKGNDELPPLLFHTHNVKEINAARANRSSGYHTKQRAPPFKDLEDEEKTAEESGRLWRKYFKRLHKEPAPELPPRNRSTLALLVGRRGERRGLIRLKIARLDKVDEKVEYARDIERLMIEDMKETYEDISERREEIELPVSGGRLDPSYEDQVRLGFNITHTGDLPDLSYFEDAVDGYDLGDDFKEWRVHVSKMLGPVERGGYGLPVTCWVWLTFEDDLERVLGEVVWVSSVWVPESFLGEMARQSASGPLAADWLKKLDEIYCKEDYRSYAVRGRNERCALGCCASPEPRIELPQRARSFSPVKCTPWYDRMQRKPVSYIQGSMLYIECKERKNLPSSRGPSLDFEIGDIEDASEESRKEESQPTSPVWSPNGPPIMTIPAQLSPMNASRSASSVESRTSPQPEIENSGVISAVRDVVSTVEKQGFVLQSDEVDSSTGGGLAEVPSQPELPEWATRIKQALDRNGAEQVGVVIGSDAESTHVDRQSKGGNDQAKSPVEDAHTLPEGISTQKPTVYNAESAAKELVDFPMPPSPVMEPGVEGVAFVGNPPMKDASIPELLHRITSAKADIAKEENKSFSSFQNQLASIRRQGLRMASMTPTVQSLRPKLPSSQSKRFMDITAEDIQAYMEDHIRLAKEFWCSGRQTEGLLFAVVTSSPVASPSRAAAKQKPEVIQLADDAMPPTPQQLKGMSQEARVEALRTREKGIQRKSDAIEREEKRTFFSVDDQLSSIEQRLSWLKKLTVTTEQYRATKNSLPKTSKRPPTPIMVWDLAAKRMEAYKKRHIGLASKAWPPSLPVQGPADHAGTPSSAPVSALEERKSEKGPMVETPPSHVAATSAAPVLASPEQKSEQGPSVDGEVFFQASSEAKHGFFEDQIKSTRLRSLIRRHRRHIAMEERQTFRSLADELESIRRRSFFMSCLTNTIRALREQRPGNELVVTLEKAASAEIAEYIKRHTRLAKEAWQAQKPGAIAAPAAATLTAAQAPPPTPVLQPVEKEVTPFDAVKLKVTVPVPPRTIYASVTVPEVNSYAPTVQRSGDARIASSNIDRFTRAQHADDQPLPPASSAPVLVPAVRSRVNAAAVQPSGVVQITSRADNVERLFPQGRPAMKLPRKSAAVQSCRSVWITEGECTGDLMGLRNGSDFESATIPAAASPSIEAAASNPIQLSSPVPSPKEPGHKHTGILRATEGRTQGTAVTVAAFRKPVKVPKRERNRHQRLRHNAIVMARRKRRNGEKRLARATEHKTHAAEPSSSGDSSDAAIVVPVAQSMAEVAAAAVVGLRSGGDPEWNDVSKPAASPSSRKIASLDTSRPAASTAPPEQSGLENTAISTKTHIEAESMAAAFADFSKPESKLSEYRNYRKCRWAMHIERVRQKRKKEEERLTLFTELKRLATEPRSSDNPPAEVDPPEPSPTSQIIAAEGEISLRGGAPHYSYGQGIDKHGSDDWERTPHPKTGLLCRTKRGATSQFEASQAPSSPPKRRVYIYTSSDVERVSQAPAQAGILARWTKEAVAQPEISLVRSSLSEVQPLNLNFIPLGVKSDPDIQREVASQKATSRQYVSVVDDSLFQGSFGHFAPTRRYTIPETLRVLKAKTQKYEYRKELLRRQGQLEYTVSLAMNSTPRPGIVTTCAESTAEKVAIPVWSETALRLKQARPQLDGHATTKDKIPAKGEIAEHLGLRGGAPRSRPSGQGIACVLEILPEEYEYDARYPLLGPNQHPADYIVREQNRNYTNYRTAIAAGSVFEFAYVAAWAEAAAENFCVPHEDQKAPRPDLVVGQVDEAATVEKARFKVEVAEGQKVSNGTADAEVLKRFKAIVDDAGIVFERMELEVERGLDLTFESPTFLNCDDGLRGDGFEAGRPTGRLPKFEITCSKRPMDTPISHLQHSKSYSQALAQRDTKLKARGLRASQYPGHLSVQFSSPRTKTQPTPRIWAASGTPSAADYSERHQTVASGPSISGPSCCNWHTEGWMVDGLPGMNNGKSAPSPPLADWSGIVTTLPVMVHMVSSYNIPHKITLKHHNITPELHNLSPTDSFPLFSKHGQGNPVELEQLHLWERFMAAELEDFDRQARESPPMASDRAPLHPNLAGLGYAKIVGHGGKGRYERPKEKCSSPSSTSSPEWFSSSEASTSTRATSVEDSAGVSKRRRIDDFAVDTMDEWESEWCSSDHSLHAPKSPKGSRKTRRRDDSDEDWTPMRGGALNADGHGHPHPDDHSNPEDEVSSHVDDAERSVTPIAYMTGRSFARRRPNAAPARHRQNIVSIASGAGLLSLTREEAEQEPAYAAMSATARWVGSTEMSFGEHTASVPARAAPGARASLAGSRLPIAAIYSSSSRGLSPIRPTTELEVAEDTRSEVTDGVIRQLRGFPQTRSGILDSLSNDHPLVAFTRNVRLEADAADVEEDQEDVHQIARSAASVVQVAALWLRYDSQSETPPWEEMREALGLPHTATQEDGLDALYRQSEVLRHLFAGFQRYREENAPDQPLAALFTEDTGLRTNDLDIEEGEIYDLAPGDFNIGFEIPPFSPLEHPRIPPGATPSEISAALCEADQREDAQEREMLVASGPRLEAIIQHGRTPTLAQMCEALGLPRTATMADVRQESGTRIEEAGSRLMEGRLHQRRQAENDRQAARAEARREERRERHAEIRAGASRWARPPPSDLSVTDSRSPSTISLERVLAEEYAEEQAAAAEAAQEAAGAPSLTQTIDLEEPITFAAGGRRVGDAMAARYGHVEVLSDGWDNPLNPSSPTARSNDGLFQGNPLRPRTPNQELGQQVLEIMRRNNPAQFRQLELLRITQSPRDHPATRAMTFGEHLVSGVPRNRQPSTPVMLGALFLRDSPGAAVNGDVTFGRDIPHPEQMPMWMRSFEHTFPTARIGGIACDQQTYIQSLIHCTIASGQGAGERGGVPEGVWYVCTFRRRLTERPKRMSDVPLLRFGRISIDHDHVNRTRDTYNSDVESDEDEEFTFCEWQALFPACAVKDMLRSTDASWGVKAMRARNWALEEMDTDPKSDGCCEALGEWWERVRGVNGAAGDCRVRKVDVRVLEP